MKVLAFAASNSRQSINKQLLTYAAAVLHSEAQKDVVVEILDLNDFEMPIYSIDRENQDGIPPLAHSFFNQIGAADALLIAYAEHNGSYSVAFKNIFDWASRIQAKVFQDKPTVLLSTSPGARGGARVLKLALEAAPHFAADVKGSISIPSFNAVFDAQTQSLSDPEWAEKLRIVVMKLV
ncbi:MAG: NADPH-dependent FMN reductase [Granulosicoccus sp.]